MLKKTKDSLIQTKNEVKNHLDRQKFAYMFGALAALFLYANLKSSKEFYKFLEEKGIDTLEFTCPEWYEEIRNK